MSTLRYKLFGIGKLPDDLRAAADAEGALHVYEGVPVAYEFSGKLPGLIVSGTNTRSYSGALALTRARLLATVSVIPKHAGKVIDHAWATNEPGPLDVTLDARGLRLSADLAKVDPEWSGHLSLHYELTFSDAELAELPARALTWNAPHEWFLKLAGVPV